MMIDCPDPESSSFEQSDKTGLLYRSRKKARQERLIDWRNALLGIQSDPRKKSIFDFRRLYVQDSTKRFLLAVRSLFGSAAGFNYKRSNHYCYPERNRYGPSGSGGAKRQSDRHRQQHRSGQNSDDRQ